MTRNTIALIGLVLLAGCSGGGDSSTTSSAPPPATPTAQPDMLVATSDGLWRGKVTGTGGLVFVRPDLHKRAVLVSEGNVYYSRLQPLDPTVSSFPLSDIWTVRLDGTGDRALVNKTNDDEIPEVVSGPWVVYLSEHHEQLIVTNGPEHWSVRSDTGQQVLLNDDAFLRLVVGVRAIFSAVATLFSVNLDGTDGRYMPQAPSTLEDLAVAAIDDQVIYVNSQEGPNNMPTSTLRIVPVSGGSSIALSEANPYTIYGGHIGSRVVYQRCEIIDGDRHRVGACDVVSVQTDGTNPVVLASQPANEAVQGVTTSQVIIRRNLSGNDQLLAVPVGGGGERLLMTMTDSEFVDLIVGDLLIVRRPSGTWSLDLNGTLAKLGTVVGDSGFVAVGDAVCVTKVTAVWCMPLNGSGPQVKITDEGKVVGFL